MQTASADVLRYFTWEHLTREDLREASKEFAELANKIAERDKKHDNPEAVVALRKLLEAKDAAVRAIL